MASSRFSVVIKSSAKTQKAYNFLPQNPINAKPNNPFPITKKPIFSKFPKPLIICSSSSSFITSISPPSDHSLSPCSENSYCEDRGEDPDLPLREIWREIQGEENWEGLLDPMNPNLRQEIIRYGEFAQACYDSFDFDPRSKYCGTCKYHPSDFFRELDLPNHNGYIVTRYLYATSNINLPNFFQKSITRYLYATSNINLPNFFQKSKLTSMWSPHANWMGYVAVSTDADEIRRLGRRDIVVAWRGTVTYLEWIYGLQDILCSPSFSDADRNSVKIEGGFC